MHDRLPACIPGRCPCDHCQDPNNPSTSEVLDQVLGTINSLLEDCSSSDTESSSSSDRGHYNPRLEEEEDQDDADGGPLSPPLHDPLTQDYFGDCSSSDEFEITLEVLCSGEESQSADTEGNENPVCMVDLICDETAIPEDSDMENDDTSPRPHSNCSCSPPMTHEGTRELTPTESLCDGLGACDLDDSDNWESPPPSYCSLYLTDGNWTCGLCGAVLTRLDLEEQGVVSYPQRIGLCYWCFAGESPFSMFD
nr:E7 [Columba livia papillomavirus 1]